MTITIRQEEPTDYKAVFKIVEKAFEKELLSDHQEQYLVERLRTSNAFIPELSLVAEYDNKVVGHILLTKIKINSGQDKFESLALAPVSVLPNYQRKGIVGMLIEKVHKKQKS